jgi:hypothetical protein
VGTDGALPAGQWWMRKSDKARPDPNGTYKSRQGWKATMKDLTPLDALGNQLCGGEGNGEPHT